MHLLNMEGKERAGQQDVAFLTIAMPTLNEEKYIRHALSSIIRQVEGLPAEILVLDGGSTDATRQIVREMAQAHPCVRLVENPKRLQSAALNLAASLASPRSSILLRADAHAAYPEHFVSACLKALKTSEAVSVVVPMRAAGRTCFQRAVAAAQNSLFGNGGSRHRNVGRSGFVEHGHHAAFDLAAFRRVGGYNESFTHNEDAEFDHRLGLAGERIYLCADAVVTYFPRESCKALARQYYNHGRGRARTLLLHRIRPKLRQLLPPAALIGSVGGLLLGTVHEAFLLAPLSYAGLCAGISVVQAIRGRDRCMLALGPAAMVMHASWAFGFLRTLIAHALRKLTGGSLVSEGFGARKA